MGCPLPTSVTRPAMVPCCGVCAFAGMVANAPKHAASTSDCNALGVPMITSLDAAVIETLGDICTLVRRHAPERSGVPKDWGWLLAGSGNRLHHRTAGTGRTW